MDRLLAPCCDGQEERHQLPAFVAASRYAQDVPINRRPNDPEKVLAQAMTNLPLKERTYVLEDFHGVADHEETPEMQQGPLRLGPTHILGT